MSERIPCKNTSCANTILVFTAERTGGFCMPCVQAAARKERDEYVRMHRRDVNEFVNVTDPVEALKIIHKKRRFDPLVNWIPCATPTDQIYVSLNTREQQRLVDYAESLVGTEQHDDAEPIVRCLAAFTDTNMESCLRAFVNHDYFSPGLPFCRASADTRDQLISRAETDEENRSDILTALAWVGDATVVALFAKWRAHPPAWDKSLYIPPQDYARQAGWELTREATRRDLYFQSCTKLVCGAAAAPKLFQAIGDRQDQCPWCNQKLTNLVDFVLSEYGFAEVGVATDRIQVATCAVCTTFGTVFGVVDRTGRGDWSPANIRPEYWSDDADSWTRLPANSLAIAGRRRALFAADYFLPTTFSQLGGHPAWVQDADYPQCPACAKTMMFLVQLDHSEFEQHAEGVFYAFICLDCRTTATSYQQT